MQKKSLKEILTHSLKSLPPTYKAQKIIVTGVLIAKYLRDKDVN